MSVLNFIEKILNKNKANRIETYSEYDLKKVEKVINENFGSYELVLHEIASDIIHVDIAIIEPNSEKDYYTLVTFGTGAKKMNNYDAYNRVEIMIHLPKCWNIHSNEEQWYWPIRLLKSLSRLPFNNNTWIGMEHTVQYEDNFFVNTNFVGVILTNAFNSNGEIPLVNLKDKSKVHFLQVIPILRDEMQFKIENNCADLLIESLPKTNNNYILNIDRESVVEVLKEKFKNNTEVK